MSLKTRPACLSTLIIIIILCASVASLAASSVKITKTKVLRFIPPVPADKREGSCWTNSNIVKRPDVWRCMSGNMIFDPCYTARDRKTIVCDARPDVKKPSGFVLQLTQPLPAPEDFGGASSSASLIELEDGTLCDPISGASGAADGVRTERISYSCRKNSENIVVFGDLKPGKVWMAEKGVLVEQKSNDDLPPFLMKNLQKVNIRTVWQ